MKQVLNFDHVSFQRGEKTILYDINWQVKPQENWAILGLNGAGKTTLLKMIHGDIWPSNGKLTVLDHLFGQTNIPQLRRKIGWVSNALQDWLHPGDLVEQIVLSGKFASIGLYERYTAAELQEACNLLTRLGGEKFLGKTYRMLSQGERQLTLIARAMMAQPELLILDEPCNGLDLFARQRLLQKISTIAQLPQSPALLLVSHYTEELLPCFTNLLLLKKGEIYATGSRQQLLTAPVLTDFYTKPIEIVSDDPRRIIVYPK
ncbi:MAG: ABC transporter ATP-binding protein [Liquorilactobacillus nagelii]|jgi:iron complex transport system ATP-binding protein|uniref:ABC transporter ATP-binding protein n=1 Tax=Liquorilactobacillus nagelii TaxID=82688 RepID=UPI00242DB802|nr:ABC transporter ATP-binding protein [Liquorilactobacillus nagelii]MCI1633743.1 ABC transporter ATP-binding protein [Liquorilactobacillus nagelii]MCI1921612.1 ABC transporter ATP-binding protein [Liquorilactobacillus nagelii]MCI1977262.1 ABC transporter ATP-binding protein [Liquorilactobacillus nagelii]